MIIGIKAHERVFNYQKRMLQRKIRFALLFHKTSITVSGDEDLLPAIIEWLDRKGYKVSHMPPMHFPSGLHSPGFWTIRWD